MKKNSLWLLPFYKAVATYFYYEKVRRTMRNAIVSYLLKNFLFILQIYLFQNQQSQLKSINGSYNR